MKCPKCRHDNPSDARFCNGCGQKLEFACPECGKTNPPGSRFCNGCGHNLSLPLEPTRRELSFDEKLKKIQKYLPKGITEKILSQRDRIEGERKQVTVMFCDMEGFTSLSEKLGSEEMYTLMDQVYEILIHKVHDYDGTVNEMTGDGIMALFGAPIALEDAPQRAIRSALAIHREISKLSDQLKSEKRIPPLRMRIGIHTGPVVVGTLGNDLRVDFKAVGDTVNLASRMEGLAEPGATYVTEDTFRLAEGLFRFEALGEKLVKGKEHPVRVYQVIAPSTRRTRFDVSAERGLTPFVGRDRELSLLLDAYERAKGGKGQAFSIVSQAGMGKSRLLYEFRKAVANEDATLLEGKCLSFSRSQAYHPIIDMLRGSFDIQEEDRKEKIKESVRQGLKRLAIEEATCLPYLFDLFSVEKGHLNQDTVNPEMRKAKIIETVNRIALASSTLRPLILIFEDLHWMDQNSEDVIRYILSSIAGARVLLILTYRPEFIHRWENKSYHSQLNLSRLSNTECLTIARHIIKSEELENQLEELVLERSEGVPFFIEEFVRSMDEQGFLHREGNRCGLAADVRDLMIPSSIQDVIMARIDLLPGGAKEVLQAGSAIEREFSFEMIRCVNELPEDQLLSHLSALRDSELIYERGIYPQSSFIFQHAMIQDVIYQTQLTQSRQKIHERIAMALEDIHKGRLEEQYEIIAGHYERSSNVEKTLQYFLLAGEKLNKHNAVQAACDFFRKAYEMVGAGVISLDNENILKLDLGLARSSLNIGDIDTAAKHYRHAIELSGSYRSLKDERKARLGLTAMMYMWPVRSEAESNLDEALKWAKQGQDRHLESVALSTRGHLTTVYGLPEKGYELACEGERIALESRNPMALSSARVVRSLMERWLGRPSRAVELTEGMFENLRGNYALAFLPIVVQSRGTALAEMGKVQDAIVLIKEGIEICEKFGASYRLGALYNCLGYCYAEICQPVTAWKMNLKSEEIARRQMADSPMGRRGYAEMHAMATVNLMENLLDQGKIDEAQDRMRAFQNETRQDDYDVFRYRWESRMQYSEARILQQQGDLDGALGVIENGIRLSREKHMPKRLGGFLRLLGEAKVKSGEMESGLLDLLEALGIFETLGNPRFLWQTHASIASCNGKLKKVEKERQHWGAAAAIIEKAAQRLTNSQDQDAFLASQSIRRILSQGKL